MLMLAAAPGTASAGTLDQQQTDVNCGSYVVGPDHQIGPVNKAQTFTAGITGGLDQVDLSLMKHSGTDSLTVEVRNVEANGAPGSTVLASATVPAADVTGQRANVPVAFASPAPVAAGEQYAIVGYTTGSAEYNWGCSTRDPYAGGNLFYSQGQDAEAGAWSASPATDHAFKTYVEPEPEPEPCQVDLDLPLVDHTVDAPADSCLLRI